MSGLINSAGSKSGVIGTTELEYEEGTWTPTLAYSGGSISSHTCSYCRIGNLVNLRGQVGFGGGSTHDCTLTSLPFQPNENNKTAGAVFTNAIKYNAFPSGDADGIMISVVDSGTNGRLQVYASVDSSLGNAFQNSGSFYFSIFFETSQ